MKAGEKPIRRKRKFINNWLSTGKGQLDPLPFRNMVPEVQDKTSPTG